MIIKDKDLFYNDFVGYTGAIYQINHTNNWLSSIKLFFKDIFSISSEFTNIQGHFSFSRPSNNPDCIYNRFYFWLFVLYALIAPAPLREKSTYFEFLQ